MAGWGLRAAGECRDGYISLMRDDELSVCMSRDGDCDMEDSVTDTLSGSIISSSHTPTRQTIHIIHHSIQQYISTHNTLKHITVYIYTNTKKIQDLHIHMYLHCINTVYACMLDQYICILLIVFPPYNKRRPIISHHLILNVQDWKACSSCA